MGVEWDRRRSRADGRWHVGGLPGLRWLQLGAAAAGVSVILVSAPATAFADAEDGASPGAESSSGSTSVTAGHGTGTASGAIQTALAEPEDDSSDDDASPGFAKSVDAGADAAGVTTPVDVALDEIFADLAADITTDGVDAEVTAGGSAGLVDTGPQGTSADGDVGAESEAELEEVFAETDSDSTDEDVSPRLVSSADAEAEAVGSATPADATVDPTLAETATATSIDNVEAETARDSGESSDTSTQRTAAAEVAGQRATLATGTWDSSELDSAAPPRSRVAASTVASLPKSSTSMVSDTPPVADPIGGEAVSVSTRIAPDAATGELATPVLGASPGVAALSTSRPAYPPPVNAPVTWRSIITETLTWLGLGMNPNVPVPDVPVPDLLAGLWIGMRRLQYTFFNVAPELKPGASTEDLDTRIITGDLGGLDADGDAITYVITSAPEHGTVVVDEDGTYTYTPDADFAGGADTFTVKATDSGPASPWHIHPASNLRSGLSRILSLLGFEALPDPSTATVTVHSTAEARMTPLITLHNKSDKTIWVYNLPTSGNYSIGKDFKPVSIAKGHSAPVTLAPGTGALGSPENRIYIVEGDTGFTLPVSSPSGVDAFNPTAPSEGNSFLNYNFLEYFLYRADGGHGYEYTIDTSYIDEWSLPIQYKFSLNGADWKGAVNGKVYGFNDYDTVVNQLHAAQHAGKGPYSDLVWRGATPWDPQPPATVSRIVGPDKVWAEQFAQPASNVNMNHVGWVPTSYQDFVQYDATRNHKTGHIEYPFAQDGKKYSADGNFTFWKDSVDGPAATPYPIALRTAAIHDGFPAEHGVYGFFTYPNDETAGQFTNIPTTVSLDIYVHGSSDGVSDSVIEGGSWFYSSSSERSDVALFHHGRRDVITGTGATDTFILDSVFKNNRAAPLVAPESDHGDIVVIDRATLGATSFDVDVVRGFWTFGGRLANYDSQFVYDSSSGYLYYDEDPGRFGYTGVLAKLPRGSIDPANTVFVL